MESTVFRVIFRVYFRLVFSLFRLICIFKHFNWCADLLFILIFVYHRLFMLIIMVKHIWIRNRWTNNVNAMHNHENSRLEFRIVQCSFLQTKKGDSSGLHLGKCWFMTSVIMGTLAFTDIKLVIAFSSTSVLHFYFRFEIFLHTIHWKCLWFIHFHCWFSHESE